MPTTVIVGAGHAGARTALELADRDETMRVVLIGEESHLPYERPPMSKDLLMGDSTFDDAQVGDPGEYADLGIEVVLGTTVTAVDREAGVVRYGERGEIAFDHCVLATGSTPRQLDVPGADLDGVVTLRSYDDAVWLRDQLYDGARVCVVGASWIGCEVAATASERGAEVTIVSRHATPLSGVLGTEVGAAFRALHEEHGVTFLPGVEVARFEGESEDDEDPWVTTVVLDDDSRIDVDLVVVGIGVTPNVALAEEAGLDVEDGVLVDASLRTSDDRILAVGDIAAVDHPGIDRRIRNEHWDTAQTTPEVAVATIVGDDASYDRVPYFFSDQYDLGMEYVGWPMAWDRVVIRGSVDDRELVAWYLDEDDHLLAVAAVNEWDVIDEVRPMVAERVVVDPARCADPEIGYEQVEL